LAVEQREPIRRLFIAIIAALILSGCKTSGDNPVKIEADDSWHQVPAVGRLALNLFEVLET
jgi:hypothetical protein